MACRKNRARESGQRVTIIGHSLGGVLGRAIAASNPAIVREVIALGSPIRSGWTGVHDQVRPALQAIQTFWQTFSSAPENCGTMECSCGIADAVFAPTPPSSRFSAIYTRRDEVVQWQSCIDDAGANYEVSGLHVSLIVNREVYRILGAILADAAIRERRRLNLSRLVVSIHHWYSTKRRFRRGSSSRFRPEQGRGQASLRDSRAVASRSRSSWDSAARAADGARRFSS